MPASSSRSASRSKPLASPSAHGAGEDHPASRGDRAVGVQLAVPLDEAHLRAQRPQRQVGVEADHEALGRIEQIVARIAAHRALELRDAHLREQAIDVRPILWRDPLVEQPHRAQRVGADHRDPILELPCRFGQDAAPHEVEARSHRLLEIAGDARVGDVEHARIPEAQEDAVLVEAEIAAAAGLGDAGWTQGDAGEQVHRPVRSPEVLAADLEESAPGQLELLGGLPARGLRAQVASGLDAGAVADRGRRRFLDGDDEIAPRLAALADVGDGDAAEEAERAQAALALEDLGQAERVARLQRQRPHDRLGGGAAVADDEDAADPHQRALARRRR